MNKKPLLYAVAALAMLGSAPMAQAETVTTKTVVEAKTVPNTKEIAFAAFDVNQDGVYSMPEVGEMLFTIFDTNDDKLIDNIEWDNRNVYTITPMEKETFQYVDHNDDGLAEHATYTYDTFYKASGLIRFDEDENGLSAQEFIGVGFEELDDDEDKMINMDEWTKVYLDTLAEHEKNVNYN